MILSRAQVEEVFSECLGKDYSLVKDKASVFLNLIRVGPEAMDFDVYSTWTGYTAILLKESGVLYRLEIHILDGDVAAYLKKGWVEDNKLMFETVKEC